MLRPALALVPLVLLLPSVLLASAEQSATEARAALESFVGADPARLTEALARVSQDVLVFDEGLDGQPVRISGKPALLRHLQSRHEMLGATKESLGDVTVRATADSAWIAGTWNHQLASSDVAETWKQLVTFYLRKDASGWVLAGWHASAAEMPEIPFEGSPDEDEAGLPAPAPPGKGTP